MNTGKLSEPQPDEVAIETLAPSLKEYAKWLLADPRALEVWHLAAARLARVDCTTKDKQTLELDSGDWFLVRVSGLPTPTPTTPTLTGIIRCLRSSQMETATIADSGQLSG